MAEKISQEEVERAATALAEVLKKSQIISHLSPYTSGGEDSYAGSSKSEVKPADVGKTVEQTDYIGVKKTLVLKAQSEALTTAESFILGGLNPLGAITEKIGKGEALTSAELWAVSGGVAKAMASGEMKDIDKSEKKKEPRVGDMEREVSREVSEQKEDTMKSLLAAFVRASQQPAAPAVSPSQANQIAELQKALADERAANAAHREDMAKGLAAVAQLLAAREEREAEVKPARGPRGALTVINGGDAAPQGFGAFGPEEMTKKAVSVEIRTRLEKGDPSVNETDLLMWESDRFMRPELKALLAQNAR